MINYTQFTLPNGLRVVHNYDPQSAMAVLHVLYDTGARDESPDSTGMAHLFEHLMFGGSEHVESFDDVLQLAGGQSNAFTGQDFTNFYEVLPAQNIATAFYLESDRMQALAFSDKALEVQRHVVVEEFKQVCLNRPYGCVMHSLRPLLYSQHPYRWPVIGIKPEHIEQVTQDQVRQWHREHYAPNNAILVVCGNVTLDLARELALKWFAPIPARPVAKRHLEDDPWLKHERRADITDSVPQTAVYLAYRMDPYGHPGYLAADAITDILAAGQSSRLYQRLMLGTDLFAMANASITGSEHSGFVLLQGVLNRSDAESVDSAIAMLKAEAEQLAIPGNVTPYELQRTKNRYESTFTIENMTLTSRAHNLAMAAYHGEDINDNIPRYRALTLDDITSTARRVFVDHAPAIVVCHPRSSDK